MKLAQESFTFTLLTPCFSGGAVKSAPASMRVPPIRGHVRDWHRAAFGHDDADRTWGAAGGDHATGSRIALRLDGEVASAQVNGEVLPHKPAPQRGARGALREGQHYRLVAQRLPGCTDQAWERARSAIRLWLLLGGLGYRANRAAGSVWPLDPWCPSDEAALADLLAKLGCPAHVLIADATLGADWPSLRRAASNTIINPAFFGSPDPRKPSPIRFKVVQLADRPRLLIVCPRTHLPEAARAVLGSKPLGSAKWHPIFSPQP